MTPDRAHLIWLTQRCSTTGLVPCPFLLMTDGSGGEDNWAALPIKSRFTGHAPIITTGLLLHWAGELFHEHSLVQKWVC